VECGLCDCLVLIIPPLQAVIAPPLSSGRFVRRRDRKRKLDGTLRDACHLLRQILHHRTEFLRVCKSSTAKAGCAFVAERKSL
jgi:hypothetical protein